ncbi:MAG: molybdenum cofactor biosynthesis protein MoaE [Verrucomicrobia bacterium]|nr:molybdenum cofactor biosynthesis protein MoaE [Verrucomicrobiota bacterium]
MIKVQREDFDIGGEISRMTQDNTAIGGLSCFVGLVRDIAEDSRITSMTLEHYPGMTERQLETLEAEARQRWSLQDVLIVHRYGKLLPGDRIVLVVTASAHREASLQSCEFLIDWLKTKAPFWKLEDTESGTKWVAARKEDDAAADRWGKT